MCLAQGHNAVLSLTLQARDFWQISDFFFIISNYNFKSWISAESYENTVNAQV